MHLFELCINACIVYVVAQECQEILWELVTRWLWVGHPRFKLKLVCCVDSSDSRYKERLGSHRFYFWFFLSLWYSAVLMFLFLVHWFFLPLYRFHCVSFPQITVLIHYPVDRHLGCFWCLAISNTAFMDIVRYVSGSHV